jgi:hypothetical protein
LKNILEDEFIPDLVFEKNYSPDNSKVISRIWVEKTSVTLSNRDSWDVIFTLLNEKMGILEPFYFEFYEFIKDL